ncbi:MAG: ceramidase domain-containing protein [Paracoccaceae bacterium]
MDETGTDWTRQVGDYCERLNAAHPAGFWAEPLNAVTNAAFLIAAFVAYREAARRDRFDGPVVFLLINLCAIGVGSFLFHTFSTIWAALMDTTPIMIFILAYFTITMNRYVGLAWGWAALSILGFLAAMVAMSYVLNVLLRDIVGGSVSYGPALLSLLAIGGWLASRGHPAGRGLMIAAGLFTLSLTFRALDDPVCSALPTGTHFLWHCLNATVLGWLIVTLVRHGTAPTALRAAPA